MVDKETGLQSVLFCHDEPNMLCYLEQEHFQDPCAIYEYVNYPTPKGVWLSLNYSLPD